MYILKGNQTSHQENTFVTTVCFFNSSLNFIPEIILDSVFLLFQTPEIFHHVVTKYLFLYLSCYIFSYPKCSIHFFLSFLKCDLHRLCAVLYFLE